MLDELFIARMEGNEKIFSKVMTDAEFRSAAHEHLAHEIFRRVREKQAAVRSLSVCNCSPMMRYRISAAMLSATRAAASCMESRARCAYRAVGRDMGMTEQLADHAQTLPERQRPARPGMTEAVDPHVLQSGLRAKALPERVRVDQMDTPGSARDHPRTVSVAGNPVEHRLNRRGQQHGTRTGLRVAQPQLAPRTINVIPPELSDLVLAASG